MAAKRTNPGHTGWKRNISEEEVLKLWSKTHCELCGDITERNRRCIDHNHDTDRVRGMLCHNCNTGLGKMEKNIFKAVWYLIKTRFRRFKPHPTKGRGIGSNPNSHGNAKRK